MDWLSRDSGYLGIIGYLEIMGLVVCDINGYLEVNGYLEIMRLVIL